MANLIVLEVGLAIGLILIAIDPSLRYVALGVLLVATLAAFLRVRGQWFTHWCARIVRFRLRSRQRVATPVAQASLADIAEEAEDDSSVIADGDPRVNLLRLTIPDLFVAQGMDHDRRPVGLAWHDGVWTAVLLVEPTPSLVSRASEAPSLPLSALVPCLEDRGVVLDSLKVIWHCYPGSNALPSDSPALGAYMELLGPLPAAARRTTWIAVRLDPRRCPAAIRERGGGVVGAHRALIGAISRIRSALDACDIPTRPLDPDELLRSGISSAELTSATASDEPVTMNERWEGVTAAGIGHASYAITGWPKGKITDTLNALTSVRALSSTVALAISPATDDGEVGLSGLIRVSARNPRELDAADQRLESISERLGFSLTPLRGLQVAGLAATLPMGGTA
ncbi:type VII secretion protein EccE [Haloechinothrix sp. LS1_15]|uniref:type VII secretion protein EccE n=1 Tax=Haloechinothrix sp. LS1_15 TaxID=2652248 RepID=UPI002945EFDB|nr:type VII secretion protein EccE [Haloechinothrix sp. LS1_15]MDV6013096.1 type VII secretion protein EccE [Haloechinothrix sp. LS1_15]